MTKSEAEAIIRGEKTYDMVESSQSTTSESSNSLVDNTTSSTEETAPLENTSTIEDTSKEEENVVSSNTDNDLEKVNDSNSEQPNSEPNKKKSYTQEEKQRHAFAKEKNKRRDVEAKLEAKMKEIEALKAQIKKYEGLTKENFKGDEEAFTDYKIDQRLGKEKVARLEREYYDEEHEMKMAEAQSIADYRISMNYPDEKERNDYQNLVIEAENNFANLHPEIGYNRFSEFLMSEPDHTLIDFLEDSDNSPKLIRHFIKKPEAALKIMSMKNPYMKMIELKSLENRMLQHERIQAAQKKSINTNQVREIPNTGKVITNNNKQNSSIDWDKPWTKADAERYLNRKR